MAEYHNPYHFIPAKRNSRQGDLPKDEFLRSPGRVAHDRYFPETYSGRVVCRLTTAGPIFVGSEKQNEATEERPAVINPFKLDDKPAIPASTLRGMISSLAEAASNSALRVLANQHLTFRQKTKISSSAIGMVIREPKDENGNPVLDRNNNPKFKLRPLALPTIPFGQDDRAFLPKEFKDMFLEPNLKVYIGNRDSIRNEEYPYETFACKKEEYYGLKLQKRTWEIANGQSQITKDNQWNIKRHSFLLSQKPLINEEPRLWKDIPGDEQKEYTRGILRVLGCHGREDIPNTKKHELFIPYPEEAESWPEFPIQPAAIERFYCLADLRTDEEEHDPYSLLPYHLKGTDRNTDTNCKNLRLKDGDLVYFKGSGNGEVTKISFSSIWRDRVETGKGDSCRSAMTYTFFESIDPELLPFHSERNVVTMAEQMFGFVQSDKPEGHDSALAFAGRLHFAHAFIHGFQNPDTGEWIPYDRGFAEAFLPAVTLKILGSPKPPCPALYFKPSDTQPCYIEKQALSPGTHQPQGRKYYLHHHHRPQDLKPETGPWRSQHQPDMPGQDMEKCRFKQKVMVTPLRSGTVFYFHIDFNNLSERELGLLLYALEPCPEFLHKIGMGKSIGLGSVKIELVGIFRVDRQKRYTFAGFGEPRYSEVWIAPRANRDAWPEEYAIEKTAQGACLEMEKLQRGFCETMDRDIRRAIDLLGNPKELRAKVHTPLVECAKYGDEDKTFRWFVANENRSGSSEKNNRLDPEATWLEPLNNGTKKLPILSVLPWKD